MHISWNRFWNCLPPLAASLLLLAGQDSFSSDETLPKSEKFGELTLYVMPAYPVKMDWRSPASLLVSSLGGAVFNGVLNIGHVSVEVACGLGDEREPKSSSLSGTSHILTSAVPAPNDPSNDLLLKKQIGFSILESSWLGAVETPQQVMRSFAIVKNNPKRFSAVTFLVSEATCRRLIAYFGEYSAQGPRLIYGNSPRPLRKEGSGCTAFGVSFLEVAGLMTEELKRSWAVNVKVPLSLMAGYKGQRKISLFSILSSPFSWEWARDTDPNMNLEVYEPQLMHQWINSLVASPQELRAIGGELNASLGHGIAGIPAIRIDRRTVPTPTGPIFNGEPALKKNSEVTFVRSDKIVSDNGSFDLRP